MNALLYRSRWSRAALLVSPDPRRPGKWRTSRFDERGAAGHTDADTSEQAIRIAKEYGADLSTAIAVTSETVDEAITTLGVDVFSAPRKEWTGGFEKRVVCDVCRGAGTCMLCDDDGMVPAGTEG